MRLNKEYISLFTDISGNNIGLLSYSLGNGSPKAYIQGGIHGGETTYWIFTRLARILKNARVNGSITLVPISNPVSWDQKFYSYTVGKFSLTDGKDFNRNFPGSLTGSLNERIASKINEIALRSDMVIDLHTANKCVPYSIITDKKQLKWVKSANFKYTMLHYFKDKNNSPLTSSATLNGKISIALECGSHDIYDSKHINRCVDGILRILKKTGVIEYKSLYTNQKQYYSDTLNKYLAPESGFVKYIVKPGETCTKDQILCTIYSSKSLTKITKICSREDGVVLLASKTHIVSEGDYLFEIIPSKTLKSY